MAAENITTARNTQKLSYELLAEHNMLGSIQVLQDMKKEEINYLKSVIADYDRAYTYSNGMLDYTNARIKEVLNYASAEEMNKLIVSATHREADISLLANKITMMKSWLLKAKEEYAAIKAEACDLYQTIGTS